MSAKATKPWPYQQYDGNMPGWENHKTDRLAYLITKRLRQAATKPLPSTIPRVTTAYTVATDDDPHGPQGTRVLAENEEDYKQRDDDMKEAKVKTWGKCITGYSGAARRTADRAHHEKPFDPVYMLDCIDKEFGVQTEKTTANVVKKFIGMEKTSNMKIADFNREWSDGVDHLARSDMDLPPKFLVNLYLISLGPKYKTVESTAAVLPTAERTLSKVMSLAVDYAGSEDHDEADHTDQALMAEVQKRGLIPVNKRPFDTAFAVTDQSERPPVRCDNCNGLWHVKAECFKNGGGLAHLNRAERSAHLDKKRRQREEQRHGNRTYVRGNETETKKPDEALVVMETENKQMKTQLANAQAIMDSHGVDIDFKKF